MPITNIFHHVYVHVEYPRIIKDKDGVRILHSEPLFQNIFILVNIRIYLGASGSAVISMGEVGTFTLVRVTEAETTKLSK